MVNMVRGGADGEYGESFEINLLSFPYDTPGVTDSENKFSWSYGERHQTYVRHQVNILV